MKEVMKVIHIYFYVRIYTISLLGYVWWLGYRCRYYTLGHEEDAHYARQYCCRIR